MTELSTNARALIETVGNADGPSVRDRERVRASLFGTIAASATIAGTTGTAFGAASATIAGAAAMAPAETVVGAGLATLTGKTTGIVALWFLAGGALGTAVATPVALYSERSEPALVAPAARGPEQQLQPPAPVAVNDAPRLAARETQAREIGALERANPRLDQPAALARKAARTEAGRPKAAPQPSAATADLADEVALLKSAQRELASANAAASLALLDDHARRYPEGALTAERLGARVFALCRLGKVEQARAAAREFLSVAAGSPLAPRVLASCAGTGTSGEAPSGDRGGER